MINDGFDVVFTPFDTDNYLPVKQIVTLTVAKAVQDSLMVSGIPDTLTFGDAPFRLIVEGGSGTGSLSFTVTAGNAATVDASGKVTITHGGITAIKVTNSGDDNHLPVSSTVTLTVNKAQQKAALEFALPKAIAYGDAPFQIVGTGGNGDGAFSYHVTSGVSVKIDASGIVTIMSPGEAVITAIKASDTDYLSQEKTIHITVDKGTQNALVISGIPQRITVGQAPFSLTVNGGSGMGALSYAVTSGNAISVSSIGTVTILKRGTAVLTVTKASDDYYHAAAATVEISVKRAASTADSAEPPPASPTPSAVPSSTVAPSPTATATPAATESPAAVMLKPLSIQTDESTGIIIATITIDDLPEGTAAIKLPSGKIVQIDGTKEKLELEIRQEDLNELGEFEIIALNDESTPMGKLRIDLSSEASLQNTIINTPSSSPVWIWAAGIVAVVMALAALVLWIKKRK